MRSSRNLIALAACGLFVWGSAVGSAAKKEEKPKEADAKKEGAKKKKEAKKGGEKGGVTDDGEGKMALPLIEGHDAKGLKIPYFGSTGQLQMVFNIGVAKRLDDDHVQMGELRVEMFDDAGKSEMVIDLPKSVLDLNTRVLSTKTKVTVRRDDFKITGDQMEFNTQTKQGQLAGNVRMLIYDPDEKNATDTPTAATQTTPTARE